MVFQSGIFFSEKFENENRIVQVKYIDVEKKKLGKITIIKTDWENNFLARIDANEAILDGGLYIINEARITYNTRYDKPITLKEHEKVKNNNYREIISEEDSSPKSIVKNLMIPTELVIENLKTRFDPPRLIGLWKLQDAIKKFKKTGLNITKYQLYYYQQIFKPIGLLVISLVACCFVTLNLRSNVNNYITVSSLIVGLVTYFLQEILVKILVFNDFAVITAILIPIIIIGSISIFVILHFQEA